MLSSETWLVAIDALRANKVKAFLTMLGVIIGSACIVMVVTVSNTGRRYILAQIEGVGANLIYAYYVPAGMQQARPLSDEVSTDDLIAARSLPNVAQVAGTIDFPMTVVVGGQERRVSLIGVTQGFQDIRNLIILHGRFFDSLDMETRSKGCLVSQQLAKLYPDENLVGQQIRVGDLTFTVIGVFRERVETFGQSEITPESVIIPFPLMKYYTGQEYIKVLYAQAAGPEYVPEVTQRVEQTLRARHRSGAVYKAENLGSILQAAQQISVALSMVLLIIGFIALVISGIGIMNIMLVTVTERTREIGIRMAIGAPRSEIRYQFLIEALLISGTGALIGILIAIGLPMALKPLLPADLSIPVSGFSILLSFFVTCTTGVLFGYLPANRAAKLQPTESLKYE